MLIQGWSLMKNIVATWMYTSPANENILHDQVGKKSSSLKTQNYYWRCVFLMFESSYSLNKSVRHLLFLNKYPPKFIDGISTCQLIDKFEIEIITLENLSKSPEGYYGSWNTQFIVLDVLDWLKENIYEEDALFLLDSDIIFNKPISSQLIQELNDKKALLYTLDYHEDHIINGLSRTELLSLSLELDKNLDISEFQYNGGEFICVKGSELGKICSVGRKVYNECLARNSTNLPKFNEEAHLLSYLAHKLVYEPYSANTYIKRIWTDRSTYSNVDGLEGELTFWHLPSEKESGFVKAFKYINKKKSIKPLYSKSEIYNIEISNIKLIYSLSLKRLKLIYRSFKAVVNLN